MGRRAEGETAGGPGFGTPSRPSAGQTVGAQLGQSGTASA